MSHWKKIQDNFDEVMSADIAGSHYEQPPKLTEEFFSVENVPESSLGHTYSLQCEGIDGMRQDLGATYFSTFRVLLQLTLFASTREQYDLAIETMEAVVRARLRASTFNGTFDGLDLIGARLLPIGSAAFVANCEFAVTLRGS